MKITGVRTISLEEYPNLTWVEIETDEGLVGLGETFFGAAAVHAYVHETAAPYLLGKDPLQIERHAKELYGYYLRFGGLGAEQRAGSAIDNALWDLLGQASGLPLHVLLGGRTRESIRAYNTCAGYGYARKPIQGVLDNTQWSNIGAGTGPYEDLEAFQQRAGELAKDLLSEGFTAMKIWPFDEYAVATDGAMLLPGDLDRGLEPLRQIRDAVGMDIDVAIELHSRWSLLAAMGLAGACVFF
jgi:L-alanine-DL-glutamate epimerase-like enolase superfamily enzyme